MDPDRQLMDDFEACRVDPHGFHHAEHIRIAWIFLRTYPYAEAERRMREGLRRLTAHVGATRKYHETMTIAWTRLVASAIALSPDAATFDDFARRHGWLLDKDTLLRFYSRERLMSDEARARWVEPDLGVVSCPSQPPEASSCAFSSSAPAAPSARRSSTPSRPATK
jgi:hypothetical protein